MPKGGLLQRQFRCPSIHDPSMCSVLTFDLWPSEGQLRDLLRDVFFFSSSCLLVFFSFKKKKPLEIEPAKIHHSFGSAFGLEVNEALKA